jgi:hypothetical protein
VWHKNAGPNSSAQPIPAQPHKNSGGNLPQQDAAILLGHRAAFNDCPG